MTGREVVRQSLAAGHVITALGREEADLSDPAACAAIVAETDAQMVINAAAYTAVDRAEEESSIAHVVNGEAPGAMAKAAADRDMPFVHISTDYVFSSGHERPHRPDDETTPANAYGASKLVGEEAIKAAGGQHVVLRTSWVFSADGNNFVKTMLRLAETRGELNVVADQVGGPTSARSIAAACLSLAEKLHTGVSGGTHHFSGAPDVSWADFAREIFRQAARDVKVNDIKTVDYPTPAKRPLNSRLDCESLSRKFGIERLDWREELSEVMKEMEAANG